MFWRSRRESKAHYTWWIITRPRHSVRTRSCCGDRLISDDSWPSTTTSVVRHFCKVGSLHEPLFFSENQVKWSFVWYKNLNKFFFRFTTIHAFARRTDGRTDRRTLFSRLVRPAFNAPRYKRYWILCIAQKQNRDPKVTFVLKYMQS